MSTILEIPLRDITPSSIQDLQNKFPSATIRIETKLAAKSRKMSEQRFWKIIALLDWRTLDAKKVLAPAIELLSHCTQNDIKEFHNILNEKLHSLDTRPFAEALGSNKFTENGDFSVDSFLYSRCCVVANGEQFYYSVLNNASKMPKEYTFEALLSVPRQAWLLKMSKDSYNHQPETWCETFSNSEGWNGIITLKERLLML